MDHDNDQIREVVREEIYFALREFNSSTRLDASEAVDVLLAEDARLEQQSD